MKTLILASASPRRKEILSLAGLSFQVLVPSCSEEGVGASAPHDYVQELSRIKCSAGVRLAAEFLDDALVIGADTIVCHNGRILGKPAGPEEAFRMLKELSGDTHSVYTGVSIQDLKSGHMETFYEKTDVIFYELTDEEIRAYIRTGEPLDKAGAYGIQRRGLYLVKEIRGDYYNVVGLPAARLIRELIKAGYEWDSWQR